MPTFNIKQLTKKIKNIFIYYISTIMHFHFENEIFLQIIHIIKSLYILLKLYGLQNYIKNIKLKIKF